MNQWTGTARGADLDIENETMQLNEGVDVSFRGEDTEIVDLTSDSATFDRTNGSAVFKTNVVLVRSGDTYASDQITARVDQNREKLIGIEGSGGLVLTISPESDLGPPGRQNLTGRKKITAGEFAGKFDGSGLMTSVQVFNSGGQVRIELLDEVERTVTSNAAQVNLGKGGAESLELFGKISMTERSDLRRKMTAQSLVVTLDPVTGDATSAIFDGNIRYSDVSNQATAERVFYDLRQDMVRFSAVPGSAPTISSGPQRVSGDELVLEPEERVLRAKGRAMTRIVNSQGTAAGDTVLFPQDEGAIFVNSDSLVIRELDGFASFSGSVRAWQGDNTLLAEELQIGSAGQTISAKGNVRTILYTTTEPGGEPVKSRSDRLDARKADQKIELLDNVVVENEGRTLTGDRAVFTFNSGQELEKIVATGNLVMREIGTGRTGSGERATYQVQEETMLLEGAPAEIQEPRGTIRGQKIMLDMKKNRVDVLQGDSPTEATYNAEPEDR
jgi:lipopolysaccharide transport protein LptA